MKISFLLHSLYNVGGTIRTTLSTATTLADRGHDIELVTVFRRRTVPVFTWDDRFRVTVLHDTRKNAPPLSPADAALAAKPAKIFPKSETRYPQYSRLTDRLIADYLRQCDADVIIGTRPGLNVFIARYAPRSAIRIAQEHLFLSKHGRRLTRRLYASYRKLDAVTTVSRTDADHYRRRMPRIADRVSHIPNSVPPTSLPPASGDSRLIVAAGRLEGIKRYDLLLAAFAKVVTRHPDWRLRIYGHGKQAKELRRIIDELGVNDTVMLMGSRHPIDAEWVKGSIAAITSDMESFGLTLVEAMDCGLAVASTACPHGPPEIIEDGERGLLTPPGDVDAFAAALERLITDEALRHRLAQAGRAHARRYSPDSIADRYEALFQRHARSGTAPTRQPVPSVSAAPRDHVDCRSLSFNHLELTVPSGSLSWRQEDHEVPAKTPLGEPAAWDGLDEGTWTLHRDGVAVPAGHIDGRALLTAPTAPPSTVVVPFSQDGVFSVRLWRRPRYAEVDHVRLDAASGTVCGRLIGDFTSQNWTAAVVKRMHREYEHAVELTVSRERFTLTIPVAAIAADSHPGDLWDLWLTGPGVGVVRPSRILDDVAQRKSVHRYPLVDVDAGLALQAYYTVDNLLSIRVKATG